MAKAKMAAAPEPAKKTVTVLRTCGPNGEAHGGFKWPLEVGAVVECPDWQPTPECGHGLHGLLDGQGDWGLLDWSLEAKALVLEVDEDSIVEIGAKVKFPRAVIREVTTLTRAICNIACDSARIAKRVADWVGEITKAAGKDAEQGHYAQLAAAGHSAKLAAAGHSAQLAASGHSAKLAAAGHSAKLAAAGDYAQLAASGDSAQLAASGDYAQLAASGCSAKLAASGHYAQLAASGHSAKLAAAGHSAQLAASGHSAKLAAAGHSAKLAAAGDYAICMATNNTCIAKTGAQGAIAITWHDGKRPRIAVGYVGEGLEADTWYRVDDAGVFVRVEATA